MRHKWSLINNPQTQHRIQKKYNLASNSTMLREQYKIEALMSTFYLIYELIKQQSFKDFPRLFDRKNTFNNRIINMKTFPIFRTSI